MSKTESAPEAIVSVDEGEIRYRRDVKKNVVDISYKGKDETSYVAIGSFSVDADVIKEHNGRIKDTFKGNPKAMFPAWVYRETLGRTHQDIRNAIESSAGKATRAAEREAEKAAKAAAKVDKKEAGKAKKGAKKEATPPTEAPDIPGSESDEQLEKAKAALNR